MEDLKPIYNCSQEVLYTACELVITSLDEELAQFTAFKPKYNSAFISSLRTDLLMARNIPALTQRKSEQEVLRINLLAKLTLCLQKLNALRLYIRDAYVITSIREVRMQEAGFNDYEKAAKANWEKLVAIMDNASAFIGLHESDLLASDNMPAHFKVDFNALKVTINPEIVAMLNLRENNKQGTLRKLKANNTVYSKIAAVCEDGVFIFNSDAAKASQFIWSTVTEIITPPSAAGLKGRITDSVTSVLIGGAVVGLKSADSPVIDATSDADGKYLFDRLPVGDYIGKVVKEGYDVYPFNVTIKTGVTSTLDFLLKAQPL